MARSERVRKEPLVEAKGDRSDLHLVLNGRRRPSEAIVGGLLFLSAGLSVIVTAGIVTFLLRESWLFFSSSVVTVREFLGQTVWQPVIGRFGVLPLLSATLMTSVIALLVAVPLGLLVAIFLSEFAGVRAYRSLTAVLRTLAGIPTIVYGFFALTFMTPLLQSLFGRDRVEVYNTASAGLVMGILIVPLVATMIERALREVPAGVRAAAASLGATTREAAMGLVVPAARRGIAAAILMAFSRAFGSAMIVALAAGAGSRMTINPLRGAETLTGFVVRVSGGDVGAGTIEYRSIFALGLVLFLVTLLLNALSRRLLRKYRSIRW
jgi:phosphate transport system permease protein